MVALAGEDVAAGISEGCVGVYEIGRAGVAAAATSGTGGDASARTMQINNSASRSG